MSKSHADYMARKQAEYVATHARRPNVRPAGSTPTITPQRTRGGQVVVVSDRDEVGERYGL